MHGIRVVPNSLFAVVKTELFGCGMSREGSSASYPSSPLIPHEIQKEISEVHPLTTIVWQRERSSFPIDASHLPFSSSTCYHSCLKNGSHGSYEYFSLPAHTTPLPFLLILPCIPQAISTGFSLSLFLVEPETSDRRFPSGSYLPSA